MAGTKRTSLIERTAAALLKGAKRAEAAQLERFVHHLFANVPPDDIQGEKAENLAGAARALFAHAQVRKAGVPKLRLYNPAQGRDGWESPHSVLEIVNDDMPFLVDSVTAEIARQDIEVRLVIHPIFAVRRDKAGRLLDLNPPGERHDGSQAESLMQIWVGELPESRHAELVAGITQVLSDVRASVVDWRAMRQRCRDLMEELEHRPPRLPKAEVAEALALLDWLDDNHFTYLGYREYAFAGSGKGTSGKIVKASGLGLLRDDKVAVFDGLRNPASLAPEVQDFIRRPELLRITKANRRSTVHRPTHMDTVAVKAFNAAGEVVGERLFVGLFTSTAYAISVRDVPLLRRKVERTLERAGFAPNSHDGKALVHILESYPRDELFQVSEADLYRIALGILHLQERRRVALFLRRDPFERFVSAMIFVPRDRFDTTLRLKLQDLVSKAYGGQVTSFNTFMSDAALARLHIIVKTSAGELPKVNEEALEAELAKAARSWSDAVEEALIAAHGEARGLELARRYARAFPAAYRDAFDGAAAADDIAHLEEAAGPKALSLNFYKPLGAGPDDGVLAFKIYVPGEPIALSDILPVLENLGLKVISEVPYSLSPEGAKTPFWMHDFALRLRAPSKLTLAEVRDKFHDVFARVWSGALENDGLNRLVLRAGLASRQLIVLRAMIRYLRQAQIPFSQDYMEQTLDQNQAITRLLVELFETRFDPQRTKGRAAAEKALVERIQAALQGVANLDEDRILRRLLNLLQVMLRTNFYQVGDGRGPEALGAEKQHLSFKLDSRLVDELPAPRPYREIFVYSPRVEGVHLRFGPVARGGLRWSDRREDFRTEVLGLVKAQQVKNAVIVPVGSKGGFVLKSPPPASAGREAFQAEGVACYRTFLRGLLDITDNLKGAKLVPPSDVVRHDGDDPYLVVAADKGTATFSDYANGVSADYGFWLGDAFASGGSAGYDHKAMGITAKGGWEAVKRHFREMGKEIQSSDFTVAGVGDMSGDVFGNAMLLSRHIRLIAAFDHRHIFVDPTPDAAKSFAERARLFKLPRSSWMDYDARLISKGGGVFDRKAKAIATTPEMRQALGLTKDSVTPNELMRAILVAPVELLWFGGIGTYVKSQGQSHAEVGDRANDALRINGRELRAKVVGEGANLGMTQLGRVEYCLAGGRCNTDAIDNSAGVDCSDHEVNIKILLGDLEARGELTRKKRDVLLARMTDEVAALVLNDNYLQTQAISVTQQLGHHLLDRLARFMRALEKAGRLDRALEYLPDDEQIAERAAAKLGLLRPELATLLSYAKIVLNQALLDSELPDDPALTGDLVRYFPEPLQKTYPAAIRRHRLKREIVATVVTNQLVNRVGITFVQEITEKTGLPAADVARAFVAARDIFQAEADWAAVAALDGKVPGPLQGQLLAEIGRLLERGTVWLLRSEGQGMSIEATVARYAASVGAGTEHLDAVLGPQDRHSLAQRLANFEKAGVPGALARRIAEAPWRSALLEVTRIAAERKIKLRHAAEAYFAVGTRFGFDALRQAAGKLSTDTAWDKLAVSALLEDLGAQQAATTSVVLAKEKKAEALAATLDHWAEARRPLIARSEQLVAEINAAAAPSLAMLAVAYRQLRSLVA